MFRWFGVSMRFSGVLVAVGGVMAVAVVVAVGGCG